MLGDNARHHLPSAKDPFGSALVGKRLVHRVEAGIESLYDYPRTSPDKIQRYVESYTGDLHRFSNQKSSL